MSEQTDTIEAVARGLHAIEDSWSDYEWEQLPKNVQELFCSQAQAAIKALINKAVSATNELVAMLEVSGETARAYGYEGRADLFEDAAATIAALKAENEQQAAILMTTARAQRSAAERYAEALRALGHGDKVPGQRQLPNYAEIAQ